MFYKGSPKRCSYIRRRRRRNFFFLLFFFFYSLSLLSGTVLDTMLAILPDTLLAAEVR